MNLQSSKVTTSPAVPEKQVFPAECAAILKNLWCYIFTVSVRYGTYSVTFADPINPGIDTSSEVIAQMESEKFHIFSVRLHVGYWLPSWILGLEIKIPFATGQIRIQQGRISLETSGGAMSKNILLAKSPDEIASHITP